MNQVVDLTAPLPRLRLASPVVVAAGPWSSGEGACEPLSAAGAGALVSKTVTLRARSGNPSPAVKPWSGGSGWLNRVGLRNPGVREFARERLPRLLQSGPPVIVSVYADAPEELGLMIEYLELSPNVKRPAGYELNASCPNGSEALSLSRLGALVRSMRQRTERPIWVKLGYEAAPALCARAYACAESGADALVACNAIPALDYAHDQEPLTPFVGALSGPALRPLSLWAVAQLSALKLLPVIGSGGVRSVSDVLAFAAAGAQAVQVGSALLDSADHVQNLVRGLHDVCSHLGLSWQEVLQARQGSDSKGSDYACLHASS